MVSLEDLMNIQVTSVSKKEQTLSRTAAAVFVITAAIFAVRARNIPDALRMAPGMDVAQINSGIWAISVRGFNYRFATKLLVLIDGRTVYTPHPPGPSGKQGVPLEDIERIEVTRGPDVWGANAVNGVINIITRSSQDTQGGLIAAGTGSEESASGLVQYGGKAGNKGYYRVFGRYFKVENSTAAGGGNAADGWHGSHAGMRSDWTLSRSDILTVQADLFSASEGQTLTMLSANQLPAYRTFNDTVRLGNGNILGRWKHTFSNGSEATVQGYYDRVRRWGSGPQRPQHRRRGFSIPLPGRLAARYRRGRRLPAERIRYYAKNAITFGDGHRRDWLLSIFLQDEVRLTPSVSLILGSKVEHNAYTGIEFEPSAQWVWSPNARQTIWASASRAIRQPSWFDAEARLDLATVPLGGGGFALLFHVRAVVAVEAERLLDFEAGYRVQATKRLSLDFTAFRSRYSRLPSLEPDAPYFTSIPAPPNLVLPNHRGNLAHADNYGGEAFANWNVTRWWRISPGFSFLQMKIGVVPSSRDTSTQALVGYSPKQQAQVRSTLDLAHRLEWDTSAYFVGALRKGPVPSYTRLDTRLGWRAGDSMEFSVAGQNLLTPRHMEFRQVTPVDVTQVERSLVGTVTWRF